MLYVYQYQCIFRPQIIVYCMWRRITTEFFFYMWFTLKILEIFMTLPCLFYMSARTVLSLCVTVIQKLLSRITSSIDEYNFIVEHLEPISRFSRKCDIPRLYLISHVIMERGLEPWLYILNLKNLFFFFIWKNRTQGWCDHYFRLIKPYHAWCETIHTIVKLATTWIYNFQTCKCDRLQSFRTTK